jgi:hypothetical protein
MKRLVLGLVVILFSIQTIGCGSGDSGSGSGSTADSTTPAAGTPAKGAGAPKAAANPNGPKKDQ